VTFLEFIKIRMANCEDVVRLASLHREWKAFLKANTNLTRGLR